MDGGHGVHFEQLPKFPPSAAFVPVAVFVGPVSAPRPARAGAAAETGATERDGVSAGAEEAKTQPRSHSTNQAAAWRLATFIQGRFPTYLRRLLQAGRVVVVPDATGVDATASGCIRFAVRGDASSRPLRTALQAAFQVGQFAGARVRACPHAARRSMVPALC